MRQKTLKLVGFVEYELETFYESNCLDPCEAEDMQDIREAVEWLKQNPDYIIADAEYDDRAVALKFVVHFIVPTRDDFLYHLKPFLRFDESLFRAWHLTSSSSYRIKYSEFCLLILWGFMLGSAISAYTKARSGGRPDADSP